MFKIGDFSKLSLTTIKALRYYEKEGILKPAYTDESSGYRFYETKQLVDVCRIKALRQIGLSIEEIKNINSGAQLRDILIKKKAELSNLKILLSNQISTINYLLEEKYMDCQVVLKKIPSHVIYCEERKLAGFHELTNLVLESAEECIRLNPNIKCISPEYCFCEYPGREYRERDFVARYSQAVEEIGVENERIKFKKLEATDCLCVYHKGDYSQLGSTYSYLVNYAKENGYEMTGLMREVYIDGIWNKDDVNDYLTEIQMPVKR